MSHPTRILTVSILLAIIPCLIGAQSSSGQSQFEEKVCGSDEHHAYRMRTDALYKARHLKYMASMDSVLRNPGGSPRQMPPQYTIPVVVHIIHLGESIGSGSNIPDAQVLDAIQGLNDRYANANGMGADIEIRFCLANRDPNGCPTSGINRVDGSGVPFYASEGIAYGDECGADEMAIKDLIQWPTWQYYNIWVVHDICGDIAGYAYYPNGDPYDGTVIDRASMNSSSRTLAHELGHGLNLQHTFSGDEDGGICPSDNDCSADGDEVCDTPPHKRSNCGASNPCASGGDWDNSRYNWMSYCSTPTEVGRFTEDQRTRMRATLLEEPRSWLLESEGCDNPENMQITSDDGLMCEGETRILTAIPAGGEFFIAGGPGVIEGDVLTATDGGIIEVGYTISQQNCTSSVFQPIFSKQTATSKLKPAEESICIGQATSLTGIPDGGTFTVLSGPGAIEANVLTATDAGQIKVLYTVTVLGCVSKDDAVVVSNEWPAVSIEMLNSDLLVAVPDSGIYQWLRCNPGYEVIEGATGPEFEVSTSGSYAVVILEGTCSDTSACMQVEITSVDQGLPDGQIRIYPNPVNDVLYMENEGEPAPVQLELSDMDGKRITLAGFAGQAKTSLNFSDIAPGMYILAIEVERKGRSYFRLIKM